MKTYGYLIVGQLGGNNNGASHSSVGAVAFFCLEGIEMKNYDWMKNPLVIIAFGIAGGTVIAGLLWGFGRLIEFIAIGVGIAASIITGTTAVSTLVASWAIPAATGLLGVASFSVTIVVVKKVSDNVKEKPFEWVVSLLGVLSGLFVNLSKEFFYDTPIIKIIFASISALFVAVGGFLFKTKQFLYKVIGVILILTPLVFMVLGIFIRGEDDLKQALLSVHWSAWVSVVSLFVIAVIIMALANKDTSNT